MNKLCFGIKHWQIYRMPVIKVVLSVMSQMLLSTLWNII